MKKEFTTKQLFSLTDGRLSTGMDDVSEMLSTFAGRSLFTHELPVVLKYIEQTTPKWFEIGKKQSIELVESVGDDFDLLMEHFDTHLTEDYLFISEISEEEKPQFVKFMGENSLM